jgi:hypothetical protein
VASPPRSPVSAYPLQWPAGVPRAVSRVDAPFHEIKSVMTGQHKSRQRTRKGMWPAYSELTHELRRLGAVSPVISTDIQLKADGTPYGNASCSDPGVAVYWHMRVTRGGARVLVPYSMPCDRYTRLADNLYAVAKTIEAMRAIERYGAVQTAQVFAGFAALPPGEGAAAPVVPPKPWREVLGGAWPDGLDAGELLVLAKSRYRRGADDAHPDRGGDAERMAELNRAWEEAQAELGAS